MGSLLILISYRTGKLLMNQNVGFYTAFLFATSYYLVELISGRIEVDHNDVAFLFYVSASIWAWVEYYYFGSKRWIFLVGLFSGIAILCKWLVGLSVYAGWIIYLVLTWFNHGERSKSVTRQISELSLALMLTILVAAPWQLFTLSFYPAETIQAFKEISIHFTTVVEGHGAPWWFYLANTKAFYGFIVMILLPFALYIAIKKQHQKTFAISFFSIPLVVYLFFSLSDSKMPSYTYVVSLPILISIGSLLDYLGWHISRRVPREYLKQAGFVLVISLIGILNLKYTKIRVKQSLAGPYMTCSTIYKFNKKVFESLNTTLPANSVVFNLKGRTYVDCMFYTGFPAYNFIPTLEQYNELKRKNRTIVIFIQSDQNLPRYLYDDKSIIIRRDLIRACDG